MLVDDAVVDALELRPALPGLIERERRELLRRTARYRDGRPPVEVRDRTVVLVDDGVATGATARVAAEVIAAARCAADRAGRAGRADATSPTASAAASTRSSASRRRGASVRSARSTARSSRRATRRSRSCCASGPAGRRAGRPGAMTVGRAGDEPSRCWRWGRRGPAPVGAGPGFRCTVPPVQGPSAAVAGRLTWATGSASPQAGTADIRGVAASSCGLAARRQAPGAGHGARRRRRAARPAGARVGRRRSGDRHRDGAGGAGQGQRGHGPASVDDAAGQGRADGGADRLGRGEPCERLGHGAGGASSSTIPNVIASVGAIAAPATISISAERELLPVASTSSRCPVPSTASMRDQRGRRRRAAATAGQQRRRRPATRGPTVQERRGTGGVAGVPTAAVTATSSAPNSTPTASSTATSVRRPGAASAPPRLRPRRRAATRATRARRRTRRWRRAARRPRRRARRRATTARPARA